MTMRLWSFTLNCEIDDDGAEHTYYELAGEVTTAELVGEIEVTKAQIIAEAIDTVDGEDE